MPPALGIVTGVGMVRMARVYDDPQPADGTRILVDRLWPRGLRKDEARIDSWLKQVAPTTELRRWYNHDPELFTEFDRRYRRELAEPEQHAALAQLRELAGAGPVTLLTASKHLDISHLTVLAAVLGGA